MSVEEIIKLSMKMGDKYYIIPLANDGWYVVRDNHLGTIVLDSEHNTEEELRQFVKEHRIFNLSNVMSKTSLVFNSLIFVLCIINIFINSSFLKGFNLGALLTICIMLLVRTIVDSHNWRVKDKIMNEDIEYVNEFHKKIQKRILEGESSNKKTKGMLKEIKKNQVKEKIVKTRIKPINGENTTTTKVPKSSTKTSTRKARTKVEEKKEI